MTGAVCLQGGDEFSAAYRPVDTTLLELVDGPVVVTALAGAVGREHDTATRHGVRHFQGLGAQAVVGAPDVRTEPAAALAALRQARLLVLPGGSPARLLEVLRTTPVGQVVVDLLAAGGVVSGSSAGAMVLCGWTVLPERRPVAVVPGLGVVPGALVLPHWSGERADWVRAADAAVPADTALLGLPEGAGVLVRNGQLTGLGGVPVRLVREGRDLHPGHTARLGAA